MNGCNDQREGFLLLRKKIYPTRGTYYDCSMFHKLRSWGLLSNAEMSANWP